MGLPAAADTSPVAFFASFSLAASSLPILSSTSPLLEIITTCHQTLFEHGVAANARTIPRDVNAAIALYRSSDVTIKQLQHVLTTQIHRHTLKQLIDSMR